MKIKVVDFWIIRHKCIALRTVKQIIQINFRTFSCAKNIKNFYSISLHNKQYFLTLTEDFFSISFRILLNFKHHFKLRTSVSHLTWLFSTLNFILKLMPVYDEKGSVESHQNVVWYFSFSLHTIVVASVKHFRDHNVANSCDLKGTSGP